MTTPAADPIATMADLIADIPVAMLTTLVKDGRLVSRPMVTQKSRFNGALIFFTARSSDLIADIALNPQVNVAFVDTERHRHLSVCGTAAVVDNRELCHRHWHDAYEAWFPNGPDDPELVMVRVLVDHADTWESPSRFVASLVGFAQTILGREQKPLTGTHSQLDL